MKILSKNLAFLCIASILYIPNVQSQAQSNFLELKGITVRPLNISYLRSVIDYRMPERIQALENKAARFNITESPVYDGNFDSYEVTFTQENGAIIATYNKDGNIIQSTERFKDITLPSFIRNEIYKRHPGWTIHSDAYVVSYFGSKRVKKECKVQLRKDGQRKNIKVSI